MDFDNIMREITSGLNGDAGHDIAHLNEQMEKYKDHKMSKEIARACGRLIYKIVPEEKKAALTELLKKNEMGYEAAFEEARFNVYSKNYEKALSIFEGIINKIEKLGAFMDDAVSEYHSFNETYEEILYKFMYKPTRTVRPAHPLTAKIYFEYGVLLVELKRLEDARSALNNALRWNPMYAKVMFEYAETYKAVEAWEQFLELTKRAFKVSFRAKDLARCYRNVAFYFVEKELYDAAASCLEVSTIFDPESKTAHAELYYIHQVTDGKAKALPPDELKKVANEYGFPLGADGDVVGLAFALGKDAFEKGQKEAANYFLSIAYELTKAPEVEELLAQVGLQEE